MTKTYTRAMMVIALLTIIAGAYALAPTKVEYDHVQALSIFEADDLKGKKDFSSDVFAAKVERSVGNEPKYTVAPPNAPKDYERQEVAHEQFEVTLTEDVKGKLKAGDKITVEQAGGLTSAGAIELYEETPRLKPGEEYLFLTRYDKERGTYNIIEQPAGIVPLDEDRDKKIETYKGL